MKKIIDYLFYRYYLISIKNEEFPRFGATCVLAEVVTMVYLFAALILSFLLTGDFFLPSTSGRTRIIIGIIGCFLPCIIRKTKRCGFPKRKVSKIRKFQKRNVFYLFKHTKGRENQNNPFPCLLFYTFNSNRTSSLPPIRLIVLSMLFS